jgi:hypothetical protein
VQTRCWWLIPVIPATQEAEIRRTQVQSQPGQIVGETLSQKRAGGVAQGVGPEFKPQHCKKKRKKRKSACLSLKNKRERKKSSLP